MKSFFKIDSLEHKENETILTVTVDKLGQWCSEVEKLVLGSIDSLSIANFTGEKIVIKLGDSSADKSKNVSKLLQKGVLEFVLPLNQLEYLQSCLLQVKKDGAADVNHIHLEGTLDSKAYDLTFFFDKVKEPLSPDEMANYLKD